MGNNTNMKKKTVEKNERIFCKACGTDVTVIQTHHCLYGIAFGCQPPKEILEALNRYIKQMNKTNKSWEERLEDLSWSDWNDERPEAVYVPEVKDFIRAEINRVLDELKMEVGPNKKITVSDVDRFDPDSYIVAVRELNTKLEEIRKEYK